MFIGRKVIECIQTGTNDFAMVAFITKKLLRIGYYEVVDDDDDLREEALVQFDHNKAIKTIYQTLMAKCPTSDVNLRIQRAQTILKSFSEEVNSQMSPPLPVEVEFSLNGQPIKFEMSVEDLNSAIDILACLSDSLAQIKAIPDIHHADLYRRVFEQGVVHESTPQTRAHLTQALAQALSDSAYLDELRQRNVEQSKSFIFDGFFSKLVESFAGEYAVQFAEVCVDPQLDQTGLKEFLEEAMPSEEQAKATIESVFDQIAWS